ncbi:MAG: putative phosphatidylglycerophosphate synthase [Candidatus Saccharibacteria bacterium]|nr:putative phosphatidylglycerophosphate synthase [Candidatus Saccharibacteria bacterium]
MTMRYVPNVLSLSRLPISVIVLVLLLNESWQLATILLLIGLLTDALDGALARRFNVTSSFGGDVLEPVCDLVLGAAALGGLVLTGVWPWWSVAIVLLLMSALQLISELDRHAQKKPGYNQSLIKRLKRHQYYTHPFFAVAVITVAAASFVAQATVSDWMVAAFVVVVGVVCFLKRDRVLDLTHGPLL